MTGERRRLSRRRKPFTLYVLIDTYEFRTPFRRVGFSPRSGNNGSLPQGSELPLREGAARYTFYVTEARREGKDWLFFGWCVSMFDDDCDEWGYTTLTELLSVNVRGLTIERDLHFPIATRTVREALGHIYAA